VKGVRFAERPIFAVLFLKKCHRYSFLFRKESKTKKIVVSQIAHFSRRLDASAVAYKECETTAFI